MLVRKEVYLCRFNGFQSARLLCGDCFQFEDAKSKQMRVRVSNPKYYERVCCSFSGENYSPEVRTIHTL